MNKSKNEELEQESLQEQKKDETQPEMTSGSETEAADDNKSDDGTENSGEEELDEIAKLQKQYNELNEKYLRLYSEFDNFRRRTQKERMDIYKSAGEDILESMLPVLDNLDRAMKSIRDSKDMKSVEQGVELIRDNLYNVLAQKGLKAMKSAVNKDFDVDYHEAVTRVPAPDKKLKGKVIDEIEKGYLLHDKVIRYAKVVIGE